MSKPRKQTARNNHILQEPTQRLDVSSGRFWIWNTHPLLFSKILIATGILLVGYFSLHHYFYWRSLNLSRVQISTLQHQEDHSKEPSHIFIRWFVDAPIESMALVGQSWGISPTKVSYLIQSARPGQAGNIILYGHNTREILGNIRALKGYETITLKTQDGTEYTYTVKEMKEVDPSDVSWLQPTTTETLTMYTCSGLLDSKRFIVRAVPLKS